MIIEASFMIVASVKIPKSIVGESKSLSNLNHLTKYLALKVSKSDKPTKNKMKAMIKEIDSIERSWFKSLSYNK